MRHKHIVNINLCKLLIMKKFFNFSPYCIGLLASGLLLLSGCSQEENGFSPSSSRAISFRAQGGQDGLKATTTSSAYISSFVVNAHQSDAPDWNTYLLKGTTVYRGEGGGNNWAYAPAAYFPEGAADGDYVEFFAYSPSGSSRVTSGLSSATTADQQITYSVPAPDLNDTKGNTTQEDLLVSYGKVLKADYDKSVNLQFRHALSRVLVSAINNTASDVTITRLKLVNLKPSGTLKLTGNTKDSSEKSDGIPWSASAVEATNPTSWVYSPTTPTATTDYVTLWDASGTLTDYPYILPESGVSVSGTEKLVTSVEQGMYVLPQTAAGNGNGTWESGEFGLEVAYTRSGLAQQGKTIAFKDINGIPSTEVTFEIGRQYVLHIGFDGNGITFGSVSVEDYETPSIDVPKPVKDYVEINGVKWAKYNLGAPKTFVSSDADAGMLYQFGRGTVAWSQSDPIYSSPVGQAWNEDNIVGDWDMGSQNPCPTGWRLPNYAEAALLMSATRTYVDDSSTYGIIGWQFTDGVETLFLPEGGGVRNPDGVLSYNDNQWYYSTSTAYESDDEYAWRLYYIGKDGFGLGRYDQKATATNIRCVKF